MEARRLQTLSPALRQRFAAARVWAAHQAPYLASARLALDPVVVQVDPGERADLSAFPVDGRFGAEEAKKWCDASIRTPAEARSWRIAGVSVDDVSGEDAEPKLQKPRPKNEQLRTAQQAHARR